MGWQLPIFAGICLALLIVILVQASRIRARARENQAQKDTIINQAVEIERWRTAFDTCEKARTVAREGGGPERVLGALGGLPPPSSG